MLRSGDQIGPYILINKLGRGAFGTVWLSERRTTIATTTAALKIPLDDDVDLETIKHEANLWVRASGHPNVLPIIEANIYDEQVIIASEYAPDGSLESWLKQHGKAPTVEAAVEIISGVLAGLEHLHGRNIIHRDVKPANILFQGSTPRLADFGISRVLKSTSQSSIVAGTPAYMAPEAFDGKRNEQTDIWSVGVIFYHLLAGRLPFAQADITSLVGAILSRNPDPLPTTVPSSLQEIIARALAKDPRQRYQSASEMRADLRNPTAASQKRQREPKSVTTIPASPAHTTPPESPPSSSVRRSSSPHLIYAIAGLLAVLIVVIGIVVLLKSGAKDISSDSPANTTAVSPSESTKPPTKQTGTRQAPTQAISKPVTSSPVCVISYTSGSCWTINPPKTSSPTSVLSSDAEYTNVSVSISSDGMSCRLIVPATAGTGVRAEDSNGREFFIRQGDKFEIEASGSVLFSTDHPRVNPEGMAGWYDPYVDSPFTQNVGGLEFSIGNLAANRLFAGKYYYGTAQYSGVPVFRVIERLAGYVGDPGGFTVTIKKIQ